MRADGDGITGGQTKDCGRCRHGRTICVDDGGNGAHGIAGEHLHVMRGGKDIGTNGDTDGVAIDGINGTLEDLGFLEADGHCLETRDNVDDDCADGVGVDGGRVEGEGHGSDEATEEGGF